MSNEELTARLEVIDLVSKYARGMDTKNWRAVGKILTDKLDIDYSQATGQPATEMTRDELVNALRTLLDRSNVTVQTLTTNHVVEVSGERADSVSDLAVVHRTDEGKTFEVRGRYAFGFSKQSDSWKISKIHIHASWADGDPSIIGLG